MKVKNEEAAISELENNDLLSFIRVKKEVDKEAILRNPEIAFGLKNLKIKEGAEVFVIKPAEVKIELEKGKRKFMKDSKQLNK